tara:strand:- start:767 stop:1285 length:519 start_codon:yes stop_codon:yes gene_type:complete
MSTTKEIFNMEQQNILTENSVEDFNVSTEDLTDVVENQFFRILKILFNDEGTFYLTQKCDGNVCKTEYINLLELNKTELTLLAVCELRRRSAIVLRDSKNGITSTQLYKDAQKETQQYNGKELSEKKKRISSDSLSARMMDLFLLRKSGEITDEQFSDQVDILQFEYAPKDE